ncbi:Rieske 2Fe-2S domain-containing protein [Herbaspirillum sp. NPDC087042]|uniref:aromatic ring-hydroxylating dioxygenase subunit alpha n=1 Tax=Herbaspirillum sp. NPDC087042 TaxID=3364004 RepID=UPI003828469B
MFLKDTWYVAAWSHEISATHPFSRTIIGQPVVFWRGENGEVVALPDRCPHRAAPLSKGRIEEGQIRCMYHGLKFSSSGACVQVPGMQHIPPAACLPALRVVERSNWVWIWMGDPALADPGLIPDTYWLDSPAWRYQPDYIHYDVNYLLIADNLLDFSHLPFLHETTLGGSAGYAESRALVERSDSGVRINRWFTDGPPAPFVKNLTGWSANVDRWNIYDFLVPGVLLMDSGSAPAGQGAQAGNRENAVQFRSAQAITPESEHSSHYFFSQAHDFAIDDPRVTAQLHGDVVAAFKEDWDMIHAQQRSLALDPDFKMMPLPVDNALGHFRWLMNKRIKAQQQRVVQAGAGLQSVSATVTA